MMCERSRGFIFVSPHWPPPPSSINSCKCQCIFIVFSIVYLPDMPEVIRDERNSLKRKFLEHPELFTLSTFVYADVTFIVEMFTCSKWYVDICYIFGFNENELERLITECDTHVLSQLLQLKLTILRIEL